MEAKDVFENFKTINLTIGLPYISVTNNGVTFSKTAIVKIGSPSHVLLMMNEEEKQIAIRSIGEDDKNEDATPFVRSKNSSNLNVRWNNKDFLNTLSKMMNWNLEEHGYRINGDYFSSENAMLFDFKNAYIIGDKDSESDK